MKQFYGFSLLFLSIFFSVEAQDIGEIIYPSNTEEVTPLHKESFNNFNQCTERKQGGNPRKVNGYLVFDGSMDGNKQVDPQIAVGGGYILEGTNSGLLIFDKKGNYVQGVRQTCFNNGIDPKLFFDIHNEVFAFDLWWYYDPDKKKPVNISVSETNDPRGAWNTYPVSRTEEVDGGGIGYSRKWIGYSYPGGEENIFVLKTAEAKVGRPVTIYHFKGNFGQPVFTQDPIDDLYFLKVDNKYFTITKVSEDSEGKPFSQIVSKLPHNLKYINYPPRSPQKGTDQRISSGDRNPKNAVFQNGSIWFSQAVNCEGRSAVQWHQIDSESGKIVQTGLIKSNIENYIQTTIAVNKRSDVLLGFQSASEDTFVSPRFAYRKAKDPLGTIREIISIGEGKGASDAVPWGDYSGSIIDGDNKKDLWTIQSIANKEGKGETVIVKVPF